MIMFAVRVEIAPPLNSPTVTMSDRCYTLCDVLRSVCGLRDVTENNLTLWPVAAEPGHVGGPCRESGTAACVDANAVCGSDKKCQCKDGFIMGKENFDCSE